jgi:hypothetical protein
MAESKHIERRPSMLIVNWNGRRTATGWRAWLIVGVVSLLGALTGVVAILLLFGVVLTLGLVLIIAAPLAIILGLIAKLALPKTPEGDARHLR